MSDNDGNETEHDEEDDDDDSESEQDDGNDDHFDNSRERENWRRWRELERTISQISQNRVEKLRFAVLVLDNDAALRLGTALKWSTCLKEIGLEIWDRATVGGLQALVDGLKQSHVGKLTIGSGSQDFFQSHRSCTETLLFMAEKGIDTVTDLCIQALLTDAAANRIGAKLVGNTNLKRMDVWIGPTMTDDGARQLAVGFLHSGIEQLDLSDDRNGRDISYHNVMQVLFVEAVTKVQMITLSFILNDDDAHVLGDALLGNVSLKSLCILIRGITLPACALRLASGIRHSQITHLDLGGRNMEDNIAAQVENIIYSHGVRNANAIHHLSTGYGMRETAQLARCVSRLESLNVRNFYLDMSTFVPGLRDASRLSVLTFDGKHFQARDVALLCAVLPQLVSLTSLTLHANFTCDEAWDFEKHRSNFSRWRNQYSDLRLNNIRAVGAEALAAAVVNHPVLRCLDLRRSTDAGFLGLEMIGMCLPNLKLTCLTMGEILDGFVTDDDEFEFEFGDDPSSAPEDEDLELARKRACQALVNGVRSNFYLQVLHVNHIQLSSDLQKELNFYLDLNKLGRYIFLLERGVAPGVWCHILAKCQDHIGAVYYFLREQPVLLLAAANVADVRQNSLDAKSGRAAVAKRRRVS